MFSWIFSPLLSLMNWLNEKTKSPEPLQPRAPPAYEIMNPRLNPLQVYAPKPRRPQIQPIQEAGFIGGWVPGAPLHDQRALPPNSQAFHAPRPWADRATVISIQHSAENPHEATLNEYPKSLV